MASAIKNYNPIPDTVLDKISGHRPHLAEMCKNYKANHDIRIGNAIANAYLQGETRLSAMETWHLSHHCLGTRSYHDYCGYGK